KTYERARGPARGERAPVGGAAPPARRAPGGGVLPQAGAADAGLRVVEDHLAAARGQAGGDDRPQAAGPGLMAQVVTVAIPVYNGARYLDEVLTAVRAQRLDRELELLIFD